MPITFYDDSENDTESFTLTGSAGSDTMINWIYVQFYITEQDQIQLKYRENLLTSVDSTWLENTINLIEDLNNNDAAARGAGERLQASSFSPDVTQPLLTEFHFDLGLKTITLVSNEPIYLPSVYPPGITLLSSSSINNAGTSNFTLTNGTVSYDQPDANLKRRVQILLTDEDVLAIQLDINLAVMMSSTYISIENGTFQDMFGNDVIGVPLTNTLRASSFLADEDEADLLGYTIDLDRGILDLTFDDVVRTDTFNPTGIILQDATNPTDVTTTYRLTSGTFTPSTNDYTMRVNLSIDDLNAIKKDLSLATSINNTFLTTDPDPNNPPRAGHI